MSNWRLGSLIGVTGGAVVGAGLAALFTGEGWGMAIGLLVGYGMGCLVMYATVKNLRAEEAYRMEMRRRYGNR